MQRNSFSFDQPLDAFHIIGGSCMVKSLQLQVIVFVPLAGTDVQFVHTGLHILSRGGDALAQSLPQQIGKEMMITVPTPLVVQGVDKQISAFEIFEGCLPRSRWVEQNRIT